MPGRDRTGPEGAGPLTGRKMGFCAGNQEPGFYRRAGAGFGRGRGFRHRLRYWQDFQEFQRTVNTDLSHQDEKQLLEEEIRNMKNRLTSLENRLSDLNEQE